MAFNGAKVVVLCCFFVHFAFNAMDFVLFQFTTAGTVAFVFLVQGVTLLLYPMLGLLADVRYNRYNFVKVSIHLLFVSTMLMLGTDAAILIVLYINPFLLFWGSHAQSWALLIPAFLLLTLIISLGMFEAIGIQFGMDQMVEASSDQISAFTHWYYWSMNIGISIQALVVIGTALVLNSCVLTAKSVHSREPWDAYAIIISLIPLLIVQAVVSAAALLSLNKFKRYLTIEAAGHNPFTTVYKVLRYAWQHKCPERRSAFTYWEEDIPPRIDLGKSKYGGPFTTEEVEDVKTFLLLLLVLVSLFGFHLADNGYSVIWQLNYKLCPSASVQAGVTLSPNFLQTVTVLVSVPILHFLLLPRLHRYIPNMLHRLGIGSVLMLFQELAGMVIVLSSWVKYSGCPPITARKSMFVVAPIVDCYAGYMTFKVDNICTSPKLHNYCGQENDLFLWTLVPIIIRTIAYHLVFVTALEFISAQAPLRMKGSLITLWYALSALRFLIKAGFAVFLHEEKIWLIFKGVKASFMLLSILLYCCVAKRYRYRLRDEVVNEHYLVEEVYDRELRLAEQCEREKNEELRALYGHFPEIMPKDSSIVSQNDTLSN